MKGTLFAILSFSALNACVDMPQAKDESSDFVTGSNIPRRTRSGVVEVITKEQTEELRRAITGPMPTGRSM